MTTEWLRTADDGTARCWWPGDDEQYIRYHDEEWGRPVVDDHLLYEKLCLEGFQAGLSWLTILRKRENFRSAFAGFDADVVARFGERDVNRLLEDSGIVRHRGKIEAAIVNAGCILDLIEDEGPFGRWVWNFAPRTDHGREGTATHPSGVASTSPSAIALSAALKKRGFKFVGPTTVHSFMQSMGLVNEHVEGCHVRDVCEASRRDVVSAYDTRSN